MNLRGPAKKKLSEVQNQSQYDDYGVSVNTGIGSEKSGSSAECVIGPRDGSYLGSSPDTSILKNTIAWLDSHLATSGNWIRGHLLNDWLGGSGHYNLNLAPMSHTTNQAWNKNFEQHMKNISEVLNSYYTYNNDSNTFLVLGYTAKASGEYQPVNSGVLNRELTIIQ